MQDIKKDTQDNGVKNQRAIKEDGALTAMVPPGSSLSIALSNTEAMTTLGSIWIAKQMPRNIAEVEAKIKAMCSHETLAEKAFFSYTRGGGEITGETIHLANACMAAYGNIESGWKKIGESVNEKGIVCSDCEAYCFDKENNIIRKIAFSVPHFRETKKGGGYALTSDRDIYELCANMASRRMRACMWGVLPEFIKTLASEQCKKTLAIDKKSIEERLKAMLEKYSFLGVTEEMLEKKMGHSLSECTTNEIIYLRNLYNSLTNNIVTVEDQFGEKEDEKPPKKNEPVFKKKGDGDVIDAEVVKNEDSTAGSDLFTELN